MSSHRSNYQRAPTGVLLTLPWIKNKQEKKNNNEKLQFETHFSLSVPLRENLLVHKGGKNALSVCMCVSFMEVAVAPVCLGVLSDCLTDNPSHSQCVWQEEVSVNSLRRLHRADEGQSLLSSLSWDDLHLSFIKGLKVCDFRSLSECVNVYPWTDGKQGRISNVVN